MYARGRNSEHIVYLGGIRGERKRDKRERESRLSYVFYDSHENDVHFPSSVNYTKSFVSPFSYPGLRPRLFINTVVHYN